MPQLKKKNLSDLSKFTPFFACLPEDDLLRLESAIIRKRFAKNEVILFEEDTLNFMYLVYSGKVKVVKTTEEGKEHLLAVHRKGDSFGEMSLLDGKTAPATVMALEDTEVGLIRREDFERYLLSNDKVMREIIFILCSRLRDAWLKLKISNLKTAESRVRATLKLLSGRYGIKDQRGVKIALNLTHKEIGDYASLSRESVSRQLEKLAHANEIELLPHKQILLRAAFFENTPVC